MKKIYLLAVILPITLLFLLGIGSFMNAAAAQISSDTPTDKPTVKVTNTPPAKLTDTPTDKPTVKVTDTPPPKLTNTPTLKSTSTPTKIPTNTPTKG